MRRRPGLVTPATGGRLEREPCSRSAVDDLLGRAMADFAAGRRAPLHLRLSNGRRLRHDVGVYFTPPGRLPAPERTLLGMAQGPVLDIGCGPARHARLLQANGVAAIGLDHSHHALTLAKGLGLDRLLRADALQDPLPAGIGTALLLDGNLGLAGTASGAQQLLGRLAASSVPGARLLVGGRGPRVGDLHGWVVRHEYDGAVGPWFRWLQAGLEAVTVLGAASGWRLDHASRDGTRYLAAFRLVAACGPMASGSRHGEPGERDERRAGGCVPAGAAG